MVKIVPDRVDSKIKRLVGSQVSQILLKNSAFERWLTDPEDCLSEEKKNYMLAIIRRLKLTSPAQKRLFTIHKEFAKCIFFQPFSYKNSRGELTTNRLSMGEIFTLFKQSMSNRNPQITAKMYKSIPSLKRYLYGKHVEGYAKLTLSERYELFRTMLKSLQHRFMLNDMWKKSKGLRKKIHSDNKHALFNFYMLVNYRFGDKALSLFKNNASLRTELSYDKKEKNGSKNKDSLAKRLYFLFLICGSQSADLAKRFMRKNKDLRKILKGKKLYGERFMKLEDSEDSGVNVVMEDEELEVDEKESLAYDTSSITGLEENVDLSRSRKNVTLSPYEWLYASAKTAAFVAELIFSNKNLQTYLNSNLEECKKVFIRLLQFRKIKITNEILDTNEELKKSAYGEMGSSWSLKEQFEFFCILYFSPSSKAKEILQNNTNIKKLLSGEMALDTLLTQEDRENGLDVEAFFERWMPKENGNVQEAMRDEEDVVFSQDTEIILKLFFSALQNRHHAPFCMANYIFDHNAAVRERLLSDDNIGLIDNFPSAMRTHIVTYLFDHQPEKIEVLYRGTNFLKPVANVEWTRACKLMLGVGKNKEQAVRMIDEEAEEPKISDTFIKQFFKDVLSVYSKRRKKELQEIIETVEDENRRNTLLGYLEECYRFYNTRRRDSVQDDMSSESDSSSGSSEEEIESDKGEEESIRSQETSQTNEVLIRIWNTFYNELLMKKKVDEAARFVEIDPTLQQHPEFKCFLSAIVHHYQYNYGICEEACFEVLDKYTLHPDITWLEKRRIVRMFRAVLKKYHDVGLFAFFRLSVRLEQNLDKKLLKQFKNDIRGEEYKEFREEYDASLNLHKYIFDEEKFEDTALSNELCDFLKQYVQYYASRVNTVSDENFVELLKILSVCKRRHGEEVEKILTDIKSGTIEDILQCINRCVRNVPENNPHEFLQKMGSLLRGLFETLEGVENLKNNPVISKTTLQEIQKIIVASIAQANAKNQLAVIREIEDSLLRYLVKMVKQSAGQNMPIYKELAKQLVKIYLGFIRTQLKYPSSLNARVVTHHMKYLQQFCASDDLCGLQIAQRISSDMKGYIRSLRNNPQFFQWNTLSKFLDDLRVFYGPSENQFINYRVNVCKEVVIIFKAAIEQTSQNLQSSGNNGVQLDKVLTQLGAFLQFAKEKNITVGGGASLEERVRRVLQHVIEAKQYNGALDDMDILLEKLDGLFAKSHLANDYPSILMMLENWKRDTQPPVPSIQSQSLFAPPSSYHQIEHSRKRKPLNQLSSRADDSELEKNQRSTKRRRK